MKHIETKKGLQTLKERYLAAGADEYWVKVIDGCIAEGLAMDETDYENTPKELRKLWKGLK